MSSTDALPVPRKNVAYRLTFGIFKSDGTLITGATGLDSEVSKDAGTFADATAEATEVATSSGVYYLDLSSTEMNADTVCVLVKSTSTGAVPVVITLYPEEGGDIRVNLTQINSVSQAAINLAISAGIMLPGTVDGTGTNSTTQIETTATSEATANHFVGRAFFFADGVLAKQAAKITAYSYTGGRGRFTVEQMTDAPGSGDSFIIV
jgi:hypothetical protein